MKKLVFLWFVALFLGACAHVSETVIGYNEDGKTIVRICNARGNLGNDHAFGSSCKIEMRDYGKISNTSQTFNIISTGDR